MGKGCHSCPAILLLVREWIFRRGRVFQSYGHAPGGKGEDDFEAEGIDTVEKVEEPRVGDSERGARCQ